MADRETELREQLAALRRRYQDEAQPIVDELTKLEAMKPPSPLVYADLLSGLMGKHLAGRIDDAKVTAILGHAITRRWADEEGNLIAQPVPPEDFYAKPEGAGDA